MRVPVWAGPTFMSQSFPVVGGGLHVFGASWQACCFAGPRKLAGEKGVKSTVPKDLPWRRLGPLFVKSIEPLGEFGHRAIEIEAIAAIGYGHGKQGAGLQDLLASLQETNG